MRHHQGRLENLRSVLFISRSTNLHTLQVYHFLLSNINIYCIFSLFYIIYFSRTSRNFLSALLYLHYFLPHHHRYWFKFKGFRELKYGISFSLESLLSVLLFPHDSFSFFSQFYFIFVVVEN